MCGRVLLIALFLSAPVLSQTPPPGIVIPFDAPNSTKKKKRKPKPTKSKTSNETVDDFTTTSKPRSRKPKKAEAKSKVNSARTTPPPGTPAKTSKTAKKPPSPSKRTNKATKAATKSKGPALSKETPKATKRKKRTRKKRRARRKASKTKNTSKKISRAKRSKKKKRKTTKASKRKRNQKGRAARKSKKTARATQREVRNKMLSGKGLIETYDTAYGKIGAVSLPRAARVRAVLRGKTEREEKTILFSRGSTYVDEEYVTHLSALSDYIKSTPSILAVAVIGHADDDLGPSEHELLSAARASAVAEFLVENGVIASRLLIYGVGTSTPVSSTAKDNRAVQFEFIHQDSAMRAPSQNLSTVSLVRFSGLGTILQNGAKTSMVAPTAIGPGATLRVTSGRAALVFPCGRLMLASAGTELELKHVGRIDVDGRMNSSIRMLEGNVRISNRASKERPSTLQVVGADYQVTIQDSAASIRATRQQLSMTLDQGRVSVDLREGPSIFLSGGQTLLKNADGIAVHRRLEAPTITTSSYPSRRGNKKPIKQLGWAQVPGASSYRVETSTRIGFDWDLEHVDVVGNAFDLNEVEGRTKWFMRIYAIDEYGLLGKPSIVLVGERNNLKMAMPP